MKNENEIRCKECIHGEKLGSTNWYFCKLKRNLHTAFYWCKKAVRREDLKKRRKRNGKR